MVCNWHENQEYFDNRNAEAVEVKRLPEGNLGSSRYTKDVTTRIVTIVCLKSDETEMKKTVFLLNFKDDSYDLFSIAKEQEKKRETLASIFEQQRIALYMALKLFCGMLENNSANSSLNTRSSYFINDLRESIGDQVLSYDLDVFRRSLIESGQDIFSVVLIKNNTLKRNDNEVMAEMLVLNLFDGHAEEETIISVDSENFKEEQQWPMVMHSELFQKIEIKNKLCLKEKLTMGQILRTDNFLQCFVMVCFRIPTSSVENIGSSTTADKRGENNQLTDKDLKDSSHVSHFEKKNVIVSERLSPTTSNEMPVQESVHYTNFKCFETKRSEDLFSKCSEDSFCTVRRKRSSEICDTPLVASYDYYIAEDCEKLDFLSLAGTLKIDTKYVTFLSEFLTKFCKLQYKRRFIDFKHETMTPDTSFIVYEDCFHDDMDISLKTYNEREMLANEGRFINKTGYADKNNDTVFEDLNNREMSFHVFPVMSSPRNEPQYTHNKLELLVIEQPGYNADCFEPSEVELEKTAADKQLNVLTDIATGVYDYFSNNQSANITVIEARSSLLTDTNVGVAENVYEPFCKEVKAASTAKQETFEPSIDVDDDVCMAYIRPLSILPKFADLPAHSHIDASYLRTLVYRIEEPLLVVIDRLASDEPPTPHISMRYELLRFCTLRTYPKGDKPYLIRLAAAGFYYASDGDGVVCYCCGSRRYNWTGHEDPMKVHQGIKPNCKFLKKNEEVNVPVEYIGPLTMSLSALDAIPEPNRTQEGQENVNREYAPDRNNDRNQETLHEQQTLGVNNAEPKHSHYSIKSQRLNSFKEWPKSSKLKPEELSNAGFFYAGFGDCVRCFFCGVGLRHWSDDDDPWVEHARWARTCVFVRQKKGEEFVNLVQLAVQFTQDNGATESGAGNRLPVSTVEKLLLSKASLNAAEMGFHSDLIKRAVEAIINNGVTENVSPDELLNTILAIESRDERAITADGKRSGDCNISANESSAQLSKDKTADDPKEELVKDAKSKTDSTKKTSEKTETTKKSNSDSEVLQDPVAIKHENEVLKEQTLCKVCLDNTVCIVFLPCGHLVTCADCAPAMRKCPICRALVRGTVRTYMS